MKINRSQLKQFARPVIRCIGCNKRPEELMEYMYNPDQINPTDYVILEEGTYNRFEKGKFYCTRCYIDAGQPLYEQ